METRQNGDVEHKSAEKLTPHEEHALLRTGTNQPTDKDHERKGSRVEVDDVEGHGHGIAPDHSTNYMETMMHLFKGNIGSGVFAMGDAFKNAGILTGFFTTITLGVICLHSQRLLMKCSMKMQEKFGFEKTPDYAHTVELCFANGHPRVQKYTHVMRKAVDIFIILTQLGFCCIYFVFISSNLKQVIDGYGFVISTQMYMVIILIPIILTCLIRNLKYLVPFSTIATFCMATGIIMTAYYACQDLPPLSERKNFSTWQQLPIYFGTAIFCFEGIALVLPLQNAIKDPHDFVRPLGVHNVGTVLIILIFTSFGFIGYLSYGENVAGSLTLNLPEHDILSQLIKLTISFGVLLGYALQFYIPIDIMWPLLVKKFDVEKNLVTKELLFRCFMVVVTFAVAEAVPKIALLISFIGAFCSSALALMFPPLIELVLEFVDKKSPSKLLIVKDCFIILVGIVGFLTGTYESLTAIIKTFLE